MNGHTLDLYNASLYEKDGGMGQVSLRLTNSASDDREKG
ncbi:hypothetical protein SAMN05192543_11737 [Paraburkholderia megapolitana]|uniref:Uncharacterized protein n=1 Tax=Paraburkholderia megapolitana TaxID=420953 RepID=A0A1I3WAC3_9BURK|nr:hypothetical protein SAMN05192543_11737 [Paraburkholderia megapolitana]